MKQFLLTLPTRLKFKHARNILILSVAVWILGACGTYTAGSNSPDGAPVYHAIEHPATDHESISLDKLRSLGIEPQVISLGDQEYGIYIARKDEIEEAISTGKIRISFSLWDAKGNFVLAMPAIANSKSPFILAEGYQLRIALVPTSIHGDLRPGTSYIATLNPPQTAK